MDDNDLLDIDGQRIMIDGPLPQRIGKFTSTDHSFNFVFSEQKSRAITSGSIAPSKIQDEITALLGYFYSIHLRKIVIQLAR